MVVVRVRALGGFMLGFEEVRVVMLFVVVLVGFCIYFGGGVVRFGSGELILSPRRVLLL